MERKTARPAGKLWVLEIARRHPPPQSPVMQQLCSLYLRCSNAPCRSMAGPRRKLLLLLAVLLAGACAALQLQQPAASAASSLDAREQLPVETFEGMRAMRWLSGWFAACTR